MAPHHEAPHDGDYKPPRPLANSIGREELRALNTAENATKAVSTGRACIGSLSAGKIWTKQTPHKALEVNGALLLNGDIVLVLHFSADDASILPKGLHSLSQPSPEVLSLAEASLKEIPPKITVLDGAEFREPESCWTIPVAYQGRIVGHIKVSSDGSKILPDRKAIEDLQKFEKDG
jgi:hypothetical protein